MTDKNAAIMGLFPGNHIAGMTIEESTNSEITVN